MREPDNRDAFIVLNMLPGVGPVTVRQLLRLFDSPAAILSASEASLARVPGIGPKTARTINRWHEHAELEPELERAARAGVDIICVSDPDYPPSLKAIHDPPLCLYIRGCRHALRRADTQSLAFVGSRRTTRYGERIAETLALTATHAGWTIVSGLARGIDTVAHRTVVNANGCTIAVIGSGLAHVYPPENADLARQICDHGAIISEQPMTRRPDRRTFPMRNRIIAGMTQGTLVIEAGQHSGALITAKQALDCGRHVFAVPGPIDSPQSRGCHALLKQGAKLVESLGDIVDEFSFFPEIRQSPAQPDATRPVDETALTLTTIEAKLIALLADGELSVDELTVQTKLPAAVVLSTLLGLEIRRVVAQHPGKRYCLTQPA